MTLSSAPKPRKGSGPVMWTGHYAVFIYVPVAVMFILDDVLGRLDSGGFGLGVSIAVTAATALFCGGLSAALVHDFRLCERCVREIPQDPEAEVQRWGLVLRARHSVAFTTFIIGVFLVKTMVFIHVLSFRPAGVYYMLDALMTALIALYMVTEPVHRRLRPWCPVCGWGDDDDGDDEDELEPEPEPDPAVAL